MSYFQQVTIYIYIYIYIYNIYLIKEDKDKLPGKIQNKLLQRYRVCYHKKMGLINAYVSD
jgi:hypothetical protein